MIKKLLTVLLLVCVLGGCADEPTQKKQYKAIIKLQNGEVVEMDIERAKIYREEVKITLFDGSIYWVSADNCTIIERIEK